MEYNCLFDMEDHGIGHTIQKSIKMIEQIRFPILPYHLLEFMKSVRKISDSIQYNSVVHGRSGGDFNEKKDS